MEICQTGCHATKLNYFLREFALFSIHIEGEYGSARMPKFKG
jgi:hypothetical protein